MFKWLKRKKKQNLLPTAPLLNEQVYVRAQKAGTVTLVQAGVVIIDDIEYNGMYATLVTPGQRVVEGQAIGKVK